MIVWHTDPLVADELSRHPEALMLPPMHEGQRIVVNTGGPDTIGTVIGGNPQSNAPFFRLCVLVTFTGSARHWIERWAMRQAEMEDMRRVYKKTFAEWQHDLWYAQLAEGIPPFGPTDIPALRPVWEEGSPITYVVPKRRQRRRA